MRYTDSYSYFAGFYSRVKISKLHVLILISAILISGCSTGSLLGIRPDTKPEEIKKENAFVVAKNTPRAECYWLDENGKTSEIGENDRNYAFYCGRFVAPSIMLMKADTLTKKDLEEPNREYIWFGKDMNVGLGFMYLHNNLYKAGPGEHKKHHVYSIAPGQYQVRVTPFGSRLLHNVWPRYVINLEPGRVYYLGDFQHLIKKQVPTVLKNKVKYYKKVAITEEEARWAWFPGNSSALAEGKIIDDSGSAWKLIDSINSLKELKKINLVKDYRFWVNLEDREFFTEADL